MSRFLLAAVVAVLTASSATQSPSNRVLFVGNSLTYWNQGLWTHFEQLVRRERPPREVTTGRSV